MKEIPEHPEYLISETGEVFSTKVNRMLSIQINTSGYPFFTVQYNGKSKHLLLHRVLARVYKDLPSLDSELEVDHNDTNKLNFALNNLIVRSKAEHILKTIEERGLNTDKNYCPVCGKEIAKRATFCKQHCQNPQEITVDQIEYWVLNYSWSRAAKELGMSDNGLRKRYTRLTGKSHKDINASVA
ncbi:HNH endonuclease [Salmonella enterica]|nr:HNH endonuclease [Salmonella enterica]EJP0904602.1 HNH endonuclease [Salmonella enterica]EJP1089001.1 HNH endonuclease [Salmonella enterica]